MRRRLIRPPSDPACCPPQPRAASGPGLPPPSTARRKGFALVGGGRPPAAAEAAGRRCTGKPRALEQRGYGGRSRSNSGRTRLTSQPSSSVLTHARHARTYALRLPCPMGAKQGGRGKSANTQNHPGSLTHSGEETGWPALRNGRRETSGASDLHRHIDCYQKQSQKFQIPLSWSQTTPCAQDR